LKKALTIGVLSAAMIAGAASLVKVDSTMQAPAAVVTEAAAAESEAPPVVIRNAQVKFAQLAVSQPYMLDYERGPRIIQVPQSNERSRPVARASVQRRPEPAVTEDDEEEEYVAPPPRPRVVAPKPRTAAPPPERTPRWKLRSDTPSAPPPPGPRRAVLSAPPQGEGPTPLRPTPRFDNKAADPGEKFASPRAPAAPAAVVSETQPPLGYSPPATPAMSAPEAAPVEETSAAPTAPLPED
jgi:hypothetical protein